VLLAYTAAAQVLVAVGLKNILSGVNGTVATLAIIALQEHAAHRLHLRVALIEQQHAAAAAAAAAWPWTKKQLEKRLEDDDDDDDLLYRKTVTKKTKVKRVLSHRFAHKAPLTAVTAETA